MKFQTTFSRDLSCVEETQALLGSLTSKRSYPTVLPNECGKIEKLNMFVFLDYR